MIYEVQLCKDTSYQVYCSWLKTAQSLTNTLHSLPNNQIHIYNISDTINLDLNYASIMHHTIYNNNNNMYLKSSIQTSSIDYTKENIHITLNISSNIPIQ